MKMNTETSMQQQPSFKAWAMPVLTELGSVTAMTAGGSGTFGENTAECDWPPGSGQDGPNCHNSPRP